MDCCVQKQIKMGAKIFWLFEVSFFSTKKIRLIFLIEILSETVWPSEKWMRNCLSARLLKK